MQWDAGEAVNLVNTLRRGGVDVQRATAPFSAGGVTYAAGSYIVPAAQAYRAYVVDLLEPQEHPHAEQYPGGPPQAPYGGLSGWTLPIQMGVRSDRIEEPFTVQSAAVTEAPPAPGGVSGNGRHGYLLAPRHNAGATALNRLLASGETVRMATAGFNAAGRAWAPGTFLITAGQQTRQRLEEQARELGLHFVGIDGAPRVALRDVRRPRVAMYRSWTANMDEGWTRFVLNQHEFDLATLHNADIRSGDLSHYDVIILPDQGATSILNGTPASRAPEAFAGGIGEEGAAALQAFVRNGGRIVAFDAATEFAISQFELPVSNALAGVSRSEFYIPGSLIRMDVDNRNAVAFGMQAAGAAFFQDSRAFDIAAGAADVDVVARYAQEDLLLSGWEIGAEERLAGKAAVVRVPHGSGDVVLIGFRPQFRAWPTGTYKLIFNALFGATGAAPAN
jgi:hypothetical protein